MTHLLKNTFRQWDENGDGTISRVELVSVLSKLGHFSKQDLEAMVLEVDRNKNGVIEYDEFVEWVMRPTTSVYLANGSVGYFNAEEAFRPLFLAYDRNRNGKVTLREMRECHEVLEDSLRRSQLKSEDPSLLQHCWSMMHKASIEFRIADGDHNGELSFEEFVEWQCRATDGSGLTGPEIAELTKRMAELLRQAMQGRATKAKAKARGGRRQGAAAELQGLRDVQEQLAVCQRQLWSKRPDFILQEGGVCTGYCSTWSEPPAGISTAKLRRQHACVPLPPGDVEHVEVQVPLCLPEANASVPAREDRRWLAQVLRHVKMRSGREEDTVHYYAFVGGAWKMLHGPADYDAAVLDLAPALRVYCLLLMRADFGTRLLPWPVVQDALLAAVALSLLSEHQRLEFEHFMTSIAEELLESNGFKAKDEDGRAALADEFLEAQLKLAPLDVMAELGNLGIVQWYKLWDRR